MSFTTKNRLLLKALIVVSLPLAVVITVVYAKYILPSGYGVECFTYKFFGIYCMGCGTTRQLLCLLEGDFEQAFLYNVGSVISYAGFAYLYYLGLRWTFVDRRISTRQAYVVLTFAIVLIVYMILRNIPLEVFDVLRP